MTTAHGDPSSAQPDARPGIRAAQVGIGINALLALIKLAAGLLGNTYALVADALESTADILASLIVWSGLAIASREPDDQYPFGYGKAEALAAAVVALMLMLAACGIAVEAMREVLRPQRTPAPWTLLVLVAVVAVKWALSRWVGAVGGSIGSTAVQADATHHMSDAITSAAAFVGISIALLGSRYAGGSGWEQADDWAALLASGVIFLNGTWMLRPALHDLMDRTPGVEVVESVRRAAGSVPGVRATEKLAVRRMGLAYRITLHVQADPHLSLHDAHVLSGMVKTAIRTSIPRATAVLVHMEPYEPGSLG